MWSDADVQSVCATRLKPLTLPPFAASKSTVKTSRSFSGIAEPINDRFQGRPPPACSTGIGWEANVLLMVRGVA